MFVSFNELRRAVLARTREWDGQARLELPASYLSNELGGESGEAVEAALDLALDILAMSKAYGRAQNIVKKLERAHYGLTGSRATIADLMSELADGVICADRVAARFKFDLGDAVRHKFNETSNKMGLSTQMRFEKPRDEFDAIHS